MVEMKVYGLALDEDSQVPVLVLKDKDDGRVLPIWIGAMEAMAISLALNDVTLPRPMTHDLLLSAIGELGGTVRRVEVTTIKEGTYYAEIEVDGKDGNLRIDSRPSDAIALALRAEASIFVSPEVLEEAGRIQKDGGKPLIVTKDADKWTELLNEFDEDSKYKM